MLGKLANFFGQDATRQQAYQDFAQRYEQDPTQLSGAEIQQHYGQLADCLDERDMDQAHERAFGQLSEQERRELAQEFQYATRDPSRPFQGYAGGTDYNRMAQPRQLGRMTRIAAQQDPELLARLVGSDSPLTSTGARLAIAAVAATLASRYLSKSS